MVIGYARVSTNDQNPQLQIDALKKAGCKRIFQEHASGRNVTRPELTACLARLGKGDTLTIWRLDRLGRSLRDLIQIVQHLDSEGIQLVSLNENINTKTATGKLVFHIFATLAEFERSLLTERTQAGLEAARARGRLGGRKRVTNTKQDAQIRALWESGKFTASEISKQFGISMPTFFRRVQAKPKI